MRKCATLIIGSGKSGMEVAEFYAENKNHVIVCEQDELGGSYINNHDLILKDALDYGKEFEKYLTEFRSYRQTYEVLVTKRSEFIESLHKRETQRLTNLKLEYAKNQFIEVLYGQARLISPSLAEIKTTEGRELVSFERCVFAGGKQEVQVPYIEGSDADRVWNEFSIFTAAQYPDNIAIIGCTEETLNFAFLYANLGIKVYIFEQKKADVCLPQFDKTALNVAFKKLLSKHVEFYFETDVNEIKQTKNNLQVISKALSVEVSDVLLSTKKIFSDTIGAAEQGFKYTPNGLVTTMDAKVYGSEKLYAVGEANDKFEQGKGQEIMHNYLYAVSQEFKKSKSVKTIESSKALSTEHASDSDYLRLNQLYPRIIGAFEAVTIGLAEHNARSIYGPIIRSEAYETERGDVVKVIFNAQSERIIGIALSGQLSKECMIFGLYCVDSKKKHGEFSTYVRNFLDLL